MSIKLHGPMNSPCVKRVAVVLVEKNLHFKLCHVNLETGEHKKEPFISLNPFGQVPALEDGGLKFFETRAITQYIARRYACQGIQLLPNDPKTTAVRSAGWDTDNCGTSDPVASEGSMAVMSVWIEVESHKFDPVASILGYELVVKPKLGMTTDRAVVAENEVKLGKLLDVYESRLKESKYLAGECITLADLHHAPALDYLCGTKVKCLFDARPHVAAWAAAILARPAWAKVLEMSRQCVC